MAMSTEYLAHYGVKGMKWHQHIMAGKGVSGAAALGYEGEMAKADESMARDKDRADFYVEEAKRYARSGRFGVAKRSFDQAVDATGSYFRTGLSQVPNRVRKRGHDVVATAISNIIWR